MDSARSDELAASGPPEQVQSAVEAHNTRALQPSTPPPATVPVPVPAARIDRDAATAVVVADTDEPPATRPAPSARSSRRLGKYEFIATLGRGGMADVHLAVSMGPAGFSKLQVIKRLRANIAEEPEFRNMLLDEARLAARLNHRNVVQTNEVGLVDGEYFIAMEYLDGQPLSRVQSRAREQERTIPLAVRLWLLSEVLAGLHYAHELVDYDGTPLRVVHRDISPHNIFITYDGQVKIVDFGIALAARRLVETQAGTLKGKIAYMAPEQAFSPSSEIDRRADIFSVGVMLWEMLANRRLWRGLTDPQIISRLMRDLPDVRTAREDVPFELARICAQALARSADDRYTTAAEFRSELERYAERLGEQVTAQQVGELVSELFASERAEIRGIIERQLKSLRERNERREEMMLASDPEPTGRSSLPSLPARETYESFLAEEGPITASSPSASGATRRSTPPPGTLHAVVRPEPEQVVQPEPTKARSRLPLLAATAAIAALGGATVYLQLRDPGARAVITPAPPAESVASIPRASSSAEQPPTGAAVTEVRAAPQDAFVRAKIRVTPPDAKILVDGSELPSNPFEGKFIKDGAAHRIEMQAPGFVPQRRMLVFDSDIDLDVTLYIAQKPAAPSAAGSTTPTAPATPTASAAPAGTDVASPPPKPDPY